MIAARAIVAAKVVANGDGRPEPASEAPESPANRRPGARIRNLAIGAAVVAALLEPAFAAALTG